MTDPTGLTEPDLPAPNFQDLDLGLFYEGRGEEIAEQLVLPLLRRSVAYDRVAGYFTVGSLLAIADGIEAVWRRDGRVRAIIGGQAPPRELLRARADFDGTEDELTALKRRLLEQASSLEDELLRNRLATLAWMMKDDVLQVQIVKTDHAGPGAGTIFHNKRLLFEDAHGNAVSASGSPNETARGYTTNYEELTVHKSWPAGVPAYVDEHRSHFEEVWASDRYHDNPLRPLDVSFAEELLRRIERPQTPPEGPAPLASGSASSPSVDPFVEVLDRSPAAFLFNCGPVALYPHQEQAYLDALSRWPVRALLADEVGLGKTLEAGATIAYLERFTEIDQTVVMAPANLTKQWQEELRYHFGLDFWRYTSSGQQLVSPSGDARPASTDEQLIGETAPDRVIVSVQKARGNRRTGHIYEEVARRPDLLVVDEAHRARLRPDLEGRPDPTRLWGMLRGVTESIPHLLLVTATPFQMHWMEYFGLLDLLGLPEGWSTTEYKRSLEILSAGESRPSLHRAQRALRLIRSSVEGYRLRERDLPDDEAEMLEEILAMEGAPGLRAAKTAQKRWPTLFSLFVRTHPAQLLTVRNTRSALERAGYRFPDRNLQAPDLDIPPTIRRFRDNLDQYLRDAYGKAEESIEGKQRSVGFTRVQYHQRLTSSLHSAKRTLVHRMQKINAMEVSLGTSDNGEDDTQKATGRGLGIERAYLTNLISSVNRLVAEPDYDPKMESMADLIQEHLPDDKVLVFSRYTDTLDAALETFRTRFRHDRTPPHGMYTGEEAWIYRGKSKEPATKQDVKAALGEDLQVVFCSRAAAEGLNLQAARVLINIDVPWNPSRLEQRIGRIARVGQDANEVEIYNLWYPDSIEAKIYARLIERHELYRVAVGEAPDIIEQSIRRHLQRRLAPTSAQPAPGDPLEQLQEVRTDLQHVAIQALWRDPPPSSPRSTQLRQHLLTIASEEAENRNISIQMDDEGVTFEDVEGRRQRVSSEPGSENPFHLGAWSSRFLRDLTTRPPDDPPNQATLHSLRHEGIPLMLLVDADDSWSLIDVDKIPSALDKLRQGVPLSLSSLRSINSERLPKGRTLAETVQRASTWMPDHHRLRSVGFEEELPRNPTSIEDLALTREGSIFVEP